ncbi:HAMP domain-containing protein [Streptomonospora sp. PA3]|uniref:sensor histidine kinase n=1 Tax=Streptomonospora sp. PA3 TaxID=2607326 RepID=UPI0012DCB3A1|nr:nitrate- and nitrite sensing domain-containing protein [Streptomonospora sp. PA3]MUL42763.1 HAMP domain-containing protein [Streptomonospora sp. PA3]
MSEQGGTDRGIRAQLNRIVLIPGVTFLALFAVLSTATLTQAVSLRVATGDGRTGVYLYYSIVELQRERRLATEYASAPSEETADALRRQTGVTDEALQEVDSRAGGLRGHGDPATARIAGKYLARIDGRTGIRNDVMAGETAPQGALAAYDTMITTGIRLYDSIVHHLDDGPSATAGADAVGLMRAQESFTRGDALLSGAVAADRLTIGQQTRFASLVEGMRSRLDGLAPSLQGETERTHERMVGSSAWSRMNDIADTVIGHEPRAEIDPVTGAPPTERTPPDGLDDWRSTADDVNADLVALADAQVRAVMAATDAASTWMFNLALGGGILSLFAGTVAYGAASRSAARLTARLSRLRADTLSLAREELPRIVRRLADAEPVDLDTELRRLDHGTDEVGQVADAFNTAQRTAVSAAVKEAETRAGVNRVFLAIAHRNQSLVQRQLQLLDRVEREEDDPDLLEDLFHLDHLATRGRRNAENLIILGGGRPGRRWRNPIPLMDILRGAISETDEYTRVKLRAVPDLSLSGSVVADVIHLVAELVENATAFSPPHTVVHINSEIVPKGVAVEIEDRGLGMSAPALEEANATLEQAPEFDVMALNQDSRLGLFVVARLAAKHDISVRLCPSPYGGTRAVVLIPAALISPAEASAPGRSAPAQQDASGQGGTEGDGPAARTAGRRRREVAAGPAQPLPGPAQQPRPDEPAGPPDEQPAPAPSGSGGERPALPRRRRQANLAPQLRQDPAPTPKGGIPGLSAAESTRGPEDARRMMSAFQSGTRRGREQSDDADRPDAAPAGAPAETDDRHRSEQDPAHGTAAGGPGGDTGDAHRPPAPVGAADDRAAGRPSGQHTGESE